MAAVNGPVKIRRRKTGAAGCPTLGAGELFINFVDGMLYFGIGADGSDNATSVVGVPYASIIDLISAQTISGVKTFSASPIVPTPAVGDTTTKAASTAFVAAAIISALGQRDAKDSVRAATTANIDLTAPGATVGGVTMAAGDRFAPLGQTDGKQNGIYVWNSASAAAIRAPDADTSAKVTAGLFFFVSEGTLADTAWELTTDDPITLGTTSLAFAEWDAKAAVQASYTGVDGGYA